MKASELLLENKSKLKKKEHFNSKTKTPVIPGCFMHPDSPLVHCESELYQDKNFYHMH